MKNNYLIVLLIVIVVAFVLYIWKYPPQTDTKKGDVQPAKGQVDAETICMGQPEISAPTLRLDLINRMTKDYIEHQLKAIQNSGRMNDSDVDARTMWLDLKTLKRFLYYIEYHATVQNDVPITRLGIRSYYASYPIEDDWDDYDPDLMDGTDDIVPREYEKRHSLIFIPTIERGGKVYDFDPRNIDTYEHTLDQVYDHLERNSKPIMVLFGDRTTSQNHGSLFPPDPPGGEGVTFPQL
ncbi:hypothetical protein POV27_06830 [Aureisphaera galaxeae]|uniref:hypothetical protein n=1 Tax=Aureisphaera galaxeae TaxID=1538023 RepID=UPI00234FBFBD|nr:hypothetical protein [Aureisphaera galaxeae]MDC8003758.1 hypothetical protein [Aureisphaera galaxeae]